VAEKPKTERKKEGGTKTGGEEKVLIIPLRRKARKSPRNMRMNRSVREMKTFLARHMRTEPGNISVSQQLNERLWKGGVHNPPARIKIKVRADEEGRVFASLLEEKERQKRESKRKLGLRERLARRREEAKEEKEKPAVPEAPKEKEKTRKERPKEAPEDIDQELMLQG